MALLAWEAILHDRYTERWQLDSVQLRWLKKLPRDLAQQREKVAQAVLLKENTY